MSEIKGIIFDLGGVIAPYGDKIQEAKFISEKLRVSEREALDAVEHSDYHLAELGQETSVKSWYRTFDELNIHRPDDAILALMYSWIDRVAITSQAMLDLVDQLRAEHKVSLLSNTSAEYIQTPKRRHIFEHFDDVVLSYEVGLRKPDPAIYKLAAGHLGLLPRQLVFVDDLVVNVEGANQVGIHGVVFRGIDQLKQDLRGLGVIK
jgi:epoxide hydrolase-like predicted phosphatase